MWSHQRRKIEDQDFFFRKRGGRREGINLIIEDLWVGSKNCLEKGGTPEEKVGWTIWIKLLRENEPPQDLLSFCEEILAQAIFRHIEDTYK